MGSSEDIILDIIEMLDEKYSEDRSVTVQRIFDKYATKLVKGRQITIYLAKIGIIKPRKEEESVKEANLWVIDIARVKEFKEQGGSQLPFKCPLCGSDTMSSRYNVYQCKRCFFEGSLEDDNFLPENMK